MAQMIVNKQTGAIIFKHTKAEREANERRAKLREDAEEIEQLKEELKAKIEKLDKILEKLEEEEEGGEENG